MGVSIEPAVNINFSPQININLGGTSNNTANSNAKSEDGAKALSTLNTSDVLQDAPKLGSGQPAAATGSPVTTKDGSVAQEASMPPPILSAWTAPAGKGLKKSPADFPANSVKTAGGYVVVANGKDQSWDIFSPGQKASDKPNTHIWGDPHVEEKDGTKWDFTKSSDFLLPDGTRIAVKTTAEEGHSLSGTLEICNGADRVEIANVNTDKPSMSDVKHDGYEWRSEHENKTEGLQTFHLGGDKDNVKWFKDVDGKDQGLVTSGKFDEKKNTYVQVVDGSKKYTVDPSMQPPVGSKAYGNMLRSQLDDTFAQWHWPAAFSNVFANFLHADHVGMEIVGGVKDVFSGDNFFGGLGDIWNGFSDIGGVLGGFGNTILDLFGLSNDISKNRAGGVWF